MTASSSPDQSPRRILLLSAYDAHSHRQWRETLTAMFPEYLWTCLILPPRNFSWRIRGNSLSWAFNHRDKLSDNYDLLIATSMVDLSSLRGFVPSLAKIPTMVYFHENQFCYPGNTNTHVAGPSHSNVEPKIVSLYTALCAERIIFNSQWNQDSFMAGVSALLKKLPDHVPPGLIDLLWLRASVLPVPLPDRLFSAQNSCPAGNKPDNTLCIVWNHRHEYDKGPGLLKAMVAEMVKRKINFRLHLLGQRFRQEPPEFGDIQNILSEHYTAQDITPGHNTWLASRSEYESVLGDSHLVLSTAMHDFQGLSILEATALGCIPVAPDALAYPEYLPADCLFPLIAHDPALQASVAVDTLLQQANRLTRIDVSQFSASALKVSWQSAFDLLLRSENDLSAHSPKG